MCKSKDDLVLFVVKGLFIVNLPLSEHSHNVVSFNDMNEVATAQKASNARTKDQLKLGEEIYQGYGHKSYECCVKLDDRQSHLVCYSCNQVGHRSTECPNKSSQFSGVKNNDQTNVKKLGVKAGFAPKNASWVVVGSDFPFVKGKVNGLDCQIAPDMK